MQKKSILSATIFFILSICLCFTSCEWEQIEPVETMPENVSFQNDVMPIFNQSCNTTGCHNAGGIPPDLSAENAHNVLETGDMLNMATPENSTLYTRMIDLANPMPIAGILSESQTNIILVWITEGAKNN